MSSRSWESCVASFKLSFTQWLISKESTCNAGDEVLTTKPENSYLYLKVYSQLLSPQIPLAFSFMTACACAESLQSYLTLCDPIGLPSSSVPGILWARILLPCPPGYLPDPLLYWQAGSLLLAPPGKPLRQPRDCSKWVRLPLVQSALKSLLMNLGLPEGKVGGKG